MNHSDWMEIAQGFVRLGADKVSVFYLRDGTYFAGPFEAVEVSQDVLVRIREGGTGVEHYVPAWAISRVIRRD